MILKIPSLLLRSLVLILTKKKILLLSSLPILLGILFYIYFGHWFFGSLQEMAREFFKQYSDQISKYTSFFSLIFGALFIIITNWTFFIFVSIISAPFNDLLGKEIETLYQSNNEKETKKFSFKSFYNDCLNIFKNEFKKILFLGTLFIFGIICGFVFPPLSFIITSLMFSISFVDYSWSRNDFSFKDCLSHLKKNIFTYVFAGILFTFLISIPFLNLFFLPIAVVFFTLLFCEINRREALKLESKNIMIDP